MGAFGFDICIESGGACLETHQLDFGGGLFLVDLLKSLRRAGNIVIAVADKEAAFGAFPFDAGGGETLPGGLNGAFSDEEIGFGLIEGLGRLKTSRCELAAAFQCLRGDGLAGVGRCNVGFDLGHASFELCHAALLEFVALPFDGAGLPLVDGTLVFQHHHADACAFCGPQQFVEPGAVGSCVVDGKQRCAGLEGRADLGQGQAGDLAGNGCTQCYEARVDHRLGA